MVAVRSVDIKNDFSRISQLVYNGQKVLIARPHNQNLVLITEADYNTHFQAENSSPQNLSTLTVTANPAEKLQTPAQKREALHSLHGLLSGVDESLEEIRAQRRAKYERPD